MTKLNHERPSLVYLDNLRRELKKLPIGATATNVTPTDYAAQIDAVLHNQAEDVARAPTYPSLNSEENKVTIAILDALSDYIQASSDAIAHLKMRRGKTSKSKRHNGTQKDLPTTQNQLLRACHQFYRLLLINGFEKRDNLADWWRFLHHSFEIQGETGTGSAWEMLNDWAMREVATAIQADVERYIESRISVESCTLRKSLHNDL